MVTFDTLHSEHIKKTISANESIIAGVISTRPGVILGSDGPGVYPLALTGRVPVKVTNENGQINIGDQLIASSHPGYAMKYSSSSTPVGTGIIGIALEALLEEETEGKIMVFIRGSSASPIINHAISDLNITSSDSDSIISYESDLDLLNHNILNVKAIAGTNHWSITEDGLLKVERVETKEPVTTA